MKSIAEDFANFILNKIEIIRERFHNIPPYEPTEDHIPQLSTFSTLSEEEVKKTIIGMQSKTCELNQIPTNKLKQILQSCLPSLTKIVNLFVNTGTFNENWKTTIVRPLIKAIKKETIKTNYQSVGNLLFISKIADNVLFNNLCMTMTHITFLNFNLLIDSIMDVKPACLN